MTFLLIRLGLIPLGGGSSLTHGTSPHRPPKPLSHPHKSQRLASELPEIDGERPCRAVDEEAGIAPQVLMVGLVLDLAAARNPVPPFTDQPRMREIAAH